jgi:hypothetical protein
VGQRAPRRRHRRPLSGNTARQRRRELRLLLVGQHGRHRLDQQQHRLVASRPAAAAARSPSPRRRSPTAGASASATSGPGTTGPGRSATAGTSRA